MVNSADNLAAQKRRMIQQHLEARGIIDPAVLAAFESTPRERFVPAEWACDAYDDCPLPIGAGQTISQPYIVALMVQELDVGPNHRVLDVGLGSGYQTAILAAIASEVFAIDRIAELVTSATARLTELGLKNVQTCCGDGSAGWPAHAPFDRIICGAAAPEIPQAWIDQLADGGRIVAPVGDRATQTVIVLDKIGGQIRRRNSCAVRFVPLIGENAWQDF